jgi:SAM-dependent methyltransferase
MPPAFPRRAHPSLANGYERIAAEFLAGRGSAASGGIGVRHVRAWARSLPSDATALDLGCGSGFPITKVLVDEGLTVYGVDASPTLVAAFRRHLPGVPVACESVEASTFFDRPFDAILSWGLWFLLPTATQLDLPRRIANALQPGGRLLFTAPPQAITWLDAMTGEESRSLGAETYRRSLSAAGLSVLRKFEDEGQNHYYDAVKDGGSRGYLRPAK